MPEKSSEFLAWLDHLSALVPQLDDMADGFEGTRQALFAVWLAIRRAPKPVRDLFRGFDEEELDQAASDLDFDPLVFAVGSDASLDATGAVLRALAVRLRALEKRLIIVASASTTRRPESLLAVVGEEEAYVIVREPRHRTPKSSHAFPGRALVSTRLIPRRLDHLDVSLIFAEDFQGSVRKRSESSLVLGAGLFNGLELTEVEENGRVFVQDVRAPDQLEVIKKQISAATAANCTAVVYPELSISEATLDQVKRGLAGQWPPAKPSLIVAGSRHKVEEGKGRYNVTSILDSYGQTIAEHRKLYRYVDGTGLDEAIEVGQELHILVTAEAIYAFALCLDFCNRTEEPPYVNLDVDYVLVPSLGNETTMTSHVRRAEEVKMKIGAHTAVVQQFYGRKDGDPLGYAAVLRSSQGAAAADLATNKDWQTFEI